MKKLLIITVKNELENLKFFLNVILKTVKEYNFDYIIVDGNSTDGTLEYLKENKLNYFIQDIPGRGGAVISSYKKFNSYDWYIVFSPDGNENIYDLKTFNKLITSQNFYDLIIASRMMKNAFNEEDDKFLKPRKWANNFFNILINIVFNRDNFITDSINGYRAFSSNLLSTIDLDGYDYTFEYQMTIRAMRSNLKIYEFATKEGKRVNGHTGAPSIPTGLKFIKCFIYELYLFIGEALLKRK